MRASYTSPDIVSRFHVIRFAVQDCFSLTAQQEIRLFERGVVDITLPVWLELHHKQGQVLRSKHTIYQHFQGDANYAAAPVSLHLQLAVRRHLRVVKVTKIARHRVPLQPWPDATPGLMHLRKRFILATLSNGHMALLVNMAKYSALPWDCILSEELVQAYKPDPRPYQVAVNLLGLHSLAPSHLYHRLHLPLQCSTHRDRPYVSPRSLRGQWQVR